MARRGNKEPNKRTPNQAQASNNNTQHRQKQDRDNNKFGDPSDLLAHDYSIDLMHVPTGTKIKFKAWVTSFSDSYQSNWNTEDAYGRMDPITTFQNTARTITIEWDVVSAHESEAKKNMKACETLFKMLYPTYVTGQDNAGAISGAPLFKMKFGNLVGKAGTSALSGVETGGLMGTMGGFEYSPDFDAGFFLDGGNMFPQTISLSAEFQVVHNFKVGWDDTANEFRTSDFPYGSTGADTGGSTRGTESAHAALRPNANSNAQTRSKDLRMTGGGEGS